MHPYDSDLLEGILRDSAYRFLDNVETPQKETLADEVTLAFKNALPELDTAEKNGKLDWARYKATGIKHLARLAAFSRLNLPVGGGAYCINAAKADHGPSWRMIVSLTPETEAYGVYPRWPKREPGQQVL